jgi:glycerophosphoryl diester phosphodiesterase
MKIAAHRGYSGRYPENTMLAFQMAAEAGADEIELDVQLSKDGVAVIFHDESVERLTGRRGWVRDFRFEELAALNAAAAVYGDRFGFNPIPSLDEYFAWVKPTGIVTNIELKNGRFCYEGLEEKTLALIARHGLEDRVFFSSFNHLSLVKCKKLNPAIPCGVLASKALGNPGYYVRQGGLDFYHPDLALLDDEAVENCGNHGVGLNVWTVNGMAELLKAGDWKCRGIITDFPGVCRAWLAGTGTA